MDETDPTSPTAARGFWSWFTFWVQFLVLGLLVVIGAFAASKPQHSGDYACGIVLIVTSLALAFLRLKQRFDQGMPDWGGFLFVDNMKNLAFIVPLFIIIALAGLFLAHAFPAGMMHVAGIALFVASGVIVFFSIKRVYDCLESGPH
jgi:hypothetical protein